MNLELRNHQYKRMLEEKKGHNYQYPNDEDVLKLETLGYKYHFFGEHKTDTLSELGAKEIVDQYREKGCYSRIVCFSNEIIGAKYFSVIYRLRCQLKKE